MSKYQAPTEASLYHDVPPVVAIYGKPGWGKTTDTLYSFPNALFVAKRGALKPAVNVVGRLPKAVLYLNTLVELRAELKKMSGSNDFTGLVVDDMTMLIQTQVNEWKSKYSDGRQLYGTVGAEAMSIIADARDKAWPVIFNFWLKEPAVTNGVVVDGGPKMPGQLMTDFPGWCDLVLRLDQAPARKPWPACYRWGIAPPNGGWITKCRHGTTPREAPVNLAEILRAAGYGRFVQRAPDLQWMENVVEDAADTVLQNPTMEYTVIRELVQKAQGAGMPEDLQAWLLRDVRDRIEIRKWQTNRIARDFGIVV